MQSYRISLRVFHPEISHEDICGRIGLKPAHARSAGSSRRSGSGAPLDGRYKETYVSIPLTTKVEGDFVCGVREALDSLTEKSATMLELRESGGRCELFVGVFSDGGVGFTMTAKDMKDLANCHLDLSIDAYMEEDANAKV